MKEKGEKRKKHIAFVMGTFSLGGSEVSLINLLKAMDLSRIRVDVWIQGGSCKDRLPKEAAIIEWKSGQGKRAPDYRPASLLNRALSRFYLSDYDRNLKYYIKSRKCLTDTEYDCVIAYYGYSPEVIFTSLYRFRAGKKILWVHGNYGSGRDIAFWKKEYRLFDEIIYVSQSNRELFEKTYGTMRKAQIIYNFLDKEEIRHKAEEKVSEDFSVPVIATLGRLSREKGQLQLPEIVR